MRRHPHVSARGTPFTSRHLATRASRRLRAHRSRLASLRHAHMLRRDNERPGHARSRDQPLRRSGLPERQHHLRPRTNRSDGAQCCWSRAVGRSSPVVCTAKRKGLLTSLSYRRSVPTWELLRDQLLELEQLDPSPLSAWPDPRSIAPYTPPYRIHLRAWATDIAESLHAQYGEDVELTVGHLSYPTRACPEYLRRSAAWRAAPAADSGLHVSTV